MEPNKELIIGNNAPDVSSDFDDHATIGIEKKK